MQKTFLLGFMCVVMSSSAVADEQAKWQQERQLRIETANQMDLSIPKQLCSRSGDIVTNKDVALFKQVFVATPATDKQVEGHLSKLYKKYFVTDYRGINDFRLVEGEHFGFVDAKNSSNDSVKDSASRRDYDTVVWIRYEFDTQNTKTDHIIAKGGRCEVAKFDNQWRVIKLL
ncbi:hypothetical protein G3R49_02055 [Shewanella sp. WXL01]|uniref:hypothetical protein n=1 Tax=Shewanella sp. WXL01 TaxID=2709721 RepID=UPI00143845EF|nr:hypothetical protein [Shewanella sp. WXL01]NKF49364.1 hypothetical protein [Shewanella sp. WXL01]